MSEAERQVAVLRPRGRLVGKSATVLKAQARDMLANGQDLVLDMSEVSFTDSDGLSALVAVHKTAALNDRNFLLAGVGYNLFALLELTRLQRVFRVFPDTDCALASLAEADR